MFTTDSRTEKFLDLIGVQWSYTNDMSFTKMASTWDSQNLGRSQVRVDGAVEEYGALMDRGSAAPATILWENPKDGYEVLDGIQRLLAEELRNSVAFSAYVVKTDSLAMVKKIRVFSNYRLQGGYQESSDWTLEHAVLLLINGRVSSVEEVAELGGWSPTAVRAKKQVLDYGTLVRGVGGPEKMADSTLRVLARFAAKSDFEVAPVPLAGLLNDMKKMRLTAAESEPYIEEFFSITREKGKIHSQLARKLSDFRSDEEVIARLADPTRRRYQAMTGEGKLIKALRCALTTSERVLQSEESIYDMAEYFHIVSQVRKIMLQIEKSSKKRRRA